MTFATASSVQKRGDPKTIVAFLDESAASRGRLEFALAVCATFEAHLVGLFVQLPPRAPSDDVSALAFARGGSGLDDAIDSYLGEQDVAVAEQRSRMDASARERGFTAEWRSISSYASLRQAALHCTYSDLLVLPHASHSESLPWSAAELVLASGIPGVLVPDAWADSIGARITVAWNAARVARRAVSDAMPFLVRAEQVAIVLVDAQVGLGAHGEEPGADVAQLLARHGVRAEVDQIESEGGSVADAILAHALRFRADLIVAGAYGHSRLVELVLGSTTRKLLLETSLPILVSH